MRFITYKEQNSAVERIGVLHPDQSHIKALSDLGITYQSMNDFIEKHTEQDMQIIRVACDQGEGFELHLDDIQYIAPIPKPMQDIICLGVNYTAHAEESVRYKKEAFDLKAEYPVYFSKRVTRATGNGQDIPLYEDIVDSLDYEVELAVIIGKDGKDIPLAKCREYIFGYTIINDVSARNLQTRHKQWYFGKSLDGYTPMGPWLVTADEITYPPALRIQSYVNGELRQDSNTDMMIFDIDYVIHELSKGMTLKAGTIISMGTPEGVGMGFNPPRFLKASDEVVCEVEGIGRLVNKVEDRK